MELTKREADILYDLTARFIYTHAPVGSKTLSEENSESLSSSTIRSILFKLEELGYLESPFFSSGRVPTDKGLRLFVNELLRCHEIPAEEKEEMESVAAEHKPLPETADDLSEILSRRTHHISFFSTPMLSTMRLKAIQFISIAPCRVMGVFITSQGLIRQKAITTTDNYTDIELNAFSNFLSEMFHNKTLHEVRMDLIRGLRGIPSDKITHNAINLAENYFMQDFEMWDITLKHAESENSGKGSSEALHQFALTIMSKRRLILLLESFIESETSAPYSLIGNEMGDIALSQFAIVAYPYPKNGAGRGFVAIFGSKEMDYEGIIPRVSYAANILSNITMA